MTSKDLNSLKKSYSVKKKLIRIVGKVYMAFLLCAFFAFVFGLYFKFSSLTSQIFSNRDKIFGSIIRQSQFPGLDLDHRLRSIQSRYDLDDARIESEKLPLFGLKIHLDDSLFICFHSLTSFLFVKQSRMLQGNRLVLEKKYFSYDRLEILAVLLFYLALLAYTTYWFMRRIQAEVLTPFLEVHEYLTGDISRLQLKYTEINQLYQAIKFHKKAVELKAQVDVSAGIFHDFKTPQVTLLRKTENFVLKVKKGVSREDLLNDILKYRDDMTTQIKYLRDLAQDYREGGRDLQKVPANFCQLIEYCFKVCDVSLDQYRILIPEDLVLNLDRAKISRAMINIIGNGVSEFSRINCENCFEVVGDLLGDTLNFSVGTIGTTMSQTVLENLFEYGGGGNYGRGLGLWLVKLFIEQHSGNIFCRVCDRGVFFDIQLPVHGY